MTILNDPPKMSLTNTVTGERWSPPFNPSELKPSLKVNYNRLRLLAASNERMEYSNTGNKTIPLEFFLADLEKSPTENEFKSILDDLKFLESLAYPSEDIDYSFLGAPPVLFVWPNVMSMIVRVVSVDSEHKLFSSETLETTLLTVRLEVEEAAEQRLLSSDVRRHGDMRVRGTRLREALELP